MIYLLFPAVRWMAGILNYVAVSSLLLYRHAFMGGWQWTGSSICLGCHGSYSVRAFNYAFDTSSEMKLSWLINSLLLSHVQPSRELRQQGKQNSLILPIYIVFHHEGRDPVHMEEHYLYCPGGLAQGRVQTLLKDLLLFQCFQQGQLYCSVIAPSQLRRLKGIDHPRMSFQTHTICDTQCYFSLIEIWYLGKTEFI